MRREPRTGGSATRISARAFITTIAIILAPTIVSVIPSSLIPSAAYRRVVVAGAATVVPASYQYVPRPDYTVWRWFTAPILECGFDSTPANCRCMRG